MESTSEKRGSRGATHRVHIVLGQVHALSSQIVDEWSWDWRIGHIATKITAVFVGYEKSESKSNRDVIIRNF